MYGTLKNLDYSEKDGKKKGCGPFGNFCNALCRVKKSKDPDLEQSALARVLNTFDLSILGIGSTLGVGVYVLAGEVAKNITGPAVTIAFLIAAITSTFAGLCYAEFGARVPRAGSAYAYSYYTVGEGIAFIIGWALFIEYGIGAASVAKGISEYTNRMADDAISNAFKSIAPMHSEYLGEYIDFFAMGLCMLLAAILAIGVRSSTIANNFFTLVNLSVVLFVIISGLFKADIKNWQIDPADIPEGIDGGEGGFAPWGFLGVMKGAATCFYGFVGFDAIATTGEEVKNPQRALPLAFIIALSVIFMAYFGISSVLTLMWPYWDQSETAPFPHVYDRLGWVIPKWIVAVGACFGLFSSLFGAMFPIPRVLYSMAQDGLIFKFLGRVNSKTKTPLNASMVGGIVTAIMAAFFNLRQLVDMMSLGTLMAYTIVAICVVILRYSPDNNNDSVHDESSVLVEPQNHTMRRTFGSYFNFKGDEPSIITKRIVVFNLVVFSLLCVAFALTMSQLFGDLSRGHWPGITIISIVSFILLLVFISIASQPQSKKKLSFQIPFLPLIPCLSVFCNVYLMIVLDATTWVRFALWMAVGYIPYFFYFIWKSYKGEINENSPFEINKHNFIKLNEEILKMRWHKNTILKGIHNPAFVDDTLDRFHKISTMENNPPEIRIENEIQVNFAVVEEVDDISLHQIESVRNSIECNLKEFETKLDDNNNDIGKKLGLLIAEVHKEEEDEENWEEVQEVENLDDVVNETYGFLIGMNEDETNSTDDKSQSSKEIIVEEGKSEEAKRKEEELEEKIEVEKIEPLPPKLSRKNSRLSEVYLESIKKENKTEDVSVIEKPKRNTKIEEKYLESVKLANENVPQIPKPPPLPNQLLFSPKINTEVKFLPKKNNRVSLKYLESINSPLIKTESKITNLQENKVIPEVKKPPKPPPLPNLIEPLIPGSLPDSNEPSLKPPSALLKQIEAPVQLRHVVPVKKAETPKISFKDRLSRILQDQISYYSHRDSSPTGMIQEENEENTENLEAYEIEKYKTIKTLSKAALKDKLEFVLTRGPPKRASFRNSFDVEIDIKRKNAVNALREIENLAVTTKEDEIETKIGEKVKEENTKIVNEDEDIVKKQKMLMGNVLKTIKLKNKVNNPFFEKDDEMKTELPT